MIKKVFIVGILILACIIFVQLGINTYKNNPEIVLQTIQKQLSILPSADTYRQWLWKPGRTFLFDVNAMNLCTIGTARLEIENEETYEGRPAYRLSAVVEPNELIRSRYNAKMQIGSVVDKKSKLALKYREVATTPEKEKTKEIIFDRKNNIAIREGNKYSISEATQGPLSAFFYLLSREFEIGKEIVIDMFSKEELYEFKATPVEEKGGIIKLEGEVFRKDKTSAHGGKFILWVKDDSVRVPLLIRVYVGGIMINLRLKTVQ